MSASRSVVWSLGGQVGTLVASLASTVVLGRLLTPADFGTFAFAMTIYSMVQWLLQTGMGTYLIREPQLAPEKINAAFAAALVQGAVASLCVAIAAPLVGWFTGLAAAGWVTLSVAIIPLLCAPEGTTDGLWLREGHFGRYATFQVGKVIAQTIASIVAQVFFHLGVYSLAIGFLAYGTASLAVALPAMLLQYRARPTAHPEHWAEVRSFGSRNLLLVLGQTGSTRVPDLLIGRILSVDILGHYNRAANALDMISRTLSLALARALVPDFFRRVGDGNPLDQEVARLCDALIFLVWPALVGVAILAGPIIRLIYGPQWDIAAAALPLLCLAYAFEVARSGGGESLMVRDMITRNAWIEFAHAFYAIVLIFVGAHFGLKAALWAKVADSALTMLLYFLAMHRIGAFDIGRMAQVFGRNLLLTAAAAAPALSLMVHWHWPAQLAFGQYMLAITTSVLAWILIGSVTGHPVMARGGEMVLARLHRAT